MPIHPLRTTEQIRDSYLRYLKTIYPFQEQDLREGFWQALEAPDLLVKGPLLEASPPFAAGCSVEGLVQSGVLHPGFRTLCSDALPWRRPLYLHQEQGISKVVRDGRNAVIATGTGSGKTETFLIPILDHLLREQEAGTLREPGVRALLLYPMNALANDQVKRLRRVLSRCPDITFGRYTGETEETEVRAEERFRDQFPNDRRLPNELISRERMRRTPPHLLLTNYAMLEYLLLRPQDCEFFDGDTGRHWRFIILDEAHVYDGASGIEMAMLLRRLKDRVVRSEPGRMRCLATSATLGRGEADYPAVTAFASQIFGEPFEWVAGDPGRQDVVAATRLPLVSMGDSWGEGQASLYSALEAVMESEEQEPGKAIDDVVASATQAGVPLAVVDAARASASKRHEAERVDRFLYEVLRGDQRLRTLQDRLAEQPHFLGDLAGDLFPGQPDAAECLIHLVNLAVRARPDSNSLSLLPARYHVFARALEGAFACLNTVAHRDAEDNPPRLFLIRREECPHCGSRVVELATCARCGSTYVVGRLTRGANGGQNLVLQQLTGQPDGPSGEQAYFLIGEPLAELDEDEAVALNQDMAAIADGEGEPYTLCLGCGAISVGLAAPAGCDCDRAPKVVLRRVIPRGTSELQHCVACGARSRAGIVYRFLTGQDGPVSVLATALYQALPPATDLDAQDLPGQGRKLLAFADSRQDAAFFAPYLERTYEQLLRRRLMLKTVIEDPAGQQGRLRLQDLVGRLQHQAEEAGLFEQRQSYDERQRQMATWLMQELISWDRRMNLEGLGLLRFRLVHPNRWRPPQPLLDPPWSLTADQAWQVLELLLDTLRQQGAVTYLANVDARDEVFAPRNRELFVRESEASAADGVFGWVPKQGNNRRLDLLVRLLAHTSIPEEERRAVALSTLRGIWLHLTDPGSVWRDHLPAENRRRVGVVYRLSHHYWEAVPVVSSEAGIYRCSRCQSISYVNLSGVCPTYRCDGILQPIDRAEPTWTENHYRRLYSSLEPIPLTAEEHTAQWTSTEAAAIQEKFVRGEVNALSCSTTFELGVDVGELQAVLMRNVPPTTANYTQRAGRAGRRTESAALALTYAQRRSHDLTHYAHPERIVAGRIRPPAISVTNEKIVRRHVHSVLLAAFFRWARDEQQRSFGKVGTFFDPQQSGATGPQLLIEYLNSRPVHIREALQRIVPAELQDELGINNWGWLVGLWDSENSEGVLNRAAQEVADDLDLLRRLAEESAGERSREGYQRAMHFHSVVQTMLERDLLGFLGSRNVLPKYGFPTDVVELKTNHLTGEQGRRVELQRDLRVAISEYAPGGEVVAAKHIWVSGGLNKRPGRDWDSFEYAVCPECGLFHRSKTWIDGPCQGCGHDLFGWRRLSGHLILPEFGFVVADPPRPAGEARPQRIYSSRVYFTEYALPGQRGTSSGGPPFEDCSSLWSAQVQVRQRYSRFGKLALVNPGPANRGFEVCYVCGFARPAPEEPKTKRRQAAPAHKNPRTGRDCRGTLKPCHLGHEFMTDVLELQFDGWLASTSSYDVWLSLLYALLEGASEALGIRRDDLDGTLYPYRAGLAPNLVLYDNVPGGAGHVRRIADELNAVFLAAWRRVDGCQSCSEETSCYECLRNFRNQPYHDRLKRGLARNFLHSLLESAGIPLDGQA